MSSRASAPDSTLIVSGDIDKRIMYIKEETQIETSKDAHSKQVKKLTLRRPKGKANTELIALDTEEVAAIAAMWYDNQNLVRPKALTPPSMEERLIISNASSKLRSIIDGLKEVENRTKELGDTQEIERIYSNLLGNLPNQYAQLQKSIDALVADDQLKPADLAQALRGLKSELANNAPTSPLRFHLSQNDRVTQSLNGTVHLFDSLYTSLEKYIKVLDVKLGDDENKKHSHL